MQKRCPKNAKGPFDLCRQAADGTGGEELLFADPVPKIATSWSPDGGLLLFYRIDPQTQRDIWVLPLAPGVSSKPYPWIFGRLYLARRQGAELKGYS